MTSTRRRPSSPWAVIPSRPTTVPAWSIALTIASSVASTTASNSGLMWWLERIVSGTVSGSTTPWAPCVRPRLPVVKPMASGEQQLLPDIPVVRDDDGDAGAYRSAADLKRPIALDHGGDAATNP